MGLGVLRPRGEGSGIFKECPNCEAQLIPGDVSCHRCSFDLISGRQLSGSDGGGSKAPLVVASFVALGLGIGVLFLMKGTQPPPEPVDSHLCASPLAELRRLLIAHVDAGNEVAACRQTPPGEVACWTAAGVPAEALPESGEITVELDAMPAGFRVTCQQKGEAQVYMATKDTAEVVIPAGTGGGS